MEILNKKIVIIGSRLDGQAGISLDVFFEIGGYEVIGFIDKNPDLLEKSIGGIPVIGSTNDIATMELPAKYFHIAIGDNVARYNIFKILKKRNAQVETVIHPTAVVSKSALVGEGCFVGVNAVIGSNTKIGCVSIVSSGVIIENNDKIGNGVHIAAGVTIARCTQIADYSFIGLGSTILPNIEIGSGVMIGAGAIINKNVASNVEMIGYAAKPHKKNIYEDMRNHVKTKELSFLVSALTKHNPFISTRKCLEWIQEKRNAIKTDIKQIKFSDMDRWRFNETTGNMEHETGKFFSIEGLDIIVNDEKSMRWRQPIINQPEIGILGIITKEFNGILYFLLQAKIEPKHQYRSAVTNDSGNQEQLFMRAQWKKPAISGIFCW